VIAWFVRVRRRKLRVFNRLQLGQQSRNLSIASSQWAEQKNVVV
jgi:hypothetical protein